MSNGISVSYQMDQSFSVLKVVGGTFYIHSYFDRAFCKQTEHAINILWRQIWAVLFDYVRQKGR